MINKKMFEKQSDVNEFTKKIIDLKGESCIVKMRNGLMVDVMFSVAEDEHCEDHLRCPDYRMSWNLDGSSYRSSEFDLVELIHGI